MNKEAAQSLANKLAGLNLTADEAEALVTLLGGTVGGEVSGFGMSNAAKGGTEDINRRPGQIILGPIVGTLKEADWFVADSFSFGVEREM